MAYLGRQGLSPTGLGVAIAINGAALALLTTMATTTVFREPWKPFEAVNIPVDPPPPEPVTPPPPAPRSVADPAPQQLPYFPPATTPRPGPGIESTPVFPPSPPLQIAPVSMGEGLGAGERAPVATPAPPVLTDASVDPRYRAGFQPDYPPFERNLGRDGVVVVRVRIGTDGRVTAVEQVSATSDAFFVATRRRALSHWRFRPATRDGVAVESWREMTVRFTLADG
ncbi:TonB family protein [Sphingomonas sp. VNH70]|uniref:TonB family protein n=1 Tax=Sphingomonas silueang TaxID=3156617 RepID=UPI0032B48E78